jgi:galactokinase/mevalonate kinase-like predicted kinase
MYRITSKNINKLIYSYIERDEFIYVLSDYDRKYLCRTEAECFTVMYATYRSCYNRNIVADNNIEYNVALSGKSDTPTNIYVIQINPHEIMIIMNDSINMHIYDV